MVKGITPYGGNLPHVVNGITPYEGNLPHMVYGIWHNPIWGNLPPAWRIIAIANPGQHFYCQCECASNEEWLRILSDSWRIVPSSPQVERGDFEGFVALF